MPITFDHITKKSCVFRMRVHSPIQVLQRMMQVFTERGILLESLHVQSDPANPQSSLMLVCCQMEKDRIYRTLLVIRRIAGVVDAEKMEGK